MFDDFSLLGYFLVDTFRELSLLGYFLLDTFRELSLLGYFLLDTFRDLGRPSLIGFTRDAVLLFLFPTLSS